MFNKLFAHYLSYGASDQKTAVELRDVYDGILVPGTVAAFQREGTGGFVLSLSASNSIPYVIDPRSPLFQQSIPSPKKSHIALAKILGLPMDPAPSPEALTAEVVERVASNWVSFNLDYQNKAGGKFSKYAKRLGEIGDNLELDLAAPPHVILPPYFVANSIDDPWWKKTSEIFEATCEAAEKVDPSKKCVRVVATEKADVLNDLCGSLTDEKELMVWVSGLNEIQATVSDLIDYCDAISKARDRGQKLFALYGGFFSVALSSFGLVGSSHGIGYGESRRWIELPQSGPPPQRYYVEPFHRFVSQELAEKLWQLGVYRCNCPICEDSSPLLLDYHDIMEHSVYCRQTEIDQWASLTIDQCQQKLDKEYSQTVASINTSNLPRVFANQAEKSIEHIPTWLFALSQFSSD